MLEREEIRTKWTGWSRPLRLGKSPLFAKKDGVDAAVKGVDKFHGPAMLCVRKPKSNDPGILSISTKCLRGGSCLRLTAWCLR